MAGRVSPRWVAKREALLKRLKRRYRVFNWMVLSIMLVLTGLNVLFVWLATWCFTGNTTGQMLALVWCSGICIHHVIRRLDLRGRQWLYATWRYAIKLGTRDIAYVERDQRGQVKSVEFYYYGWFACLIRLFLLGRLTPPEARR